MPPSPMTVSAMKAATSAGSGKANDLVNGSRRLGRAHSSGSSHHGDRDRRMAPEQKQPPVAYGASALLASHVAGDAKSRTKTAVKTRLQGEMNSGVPVGRRQRTSFEQGPMASAPLLPKKVFVNPGGGRSARSSPQDRRLAGNMIHDTTSSGRAYLFVPSPPR